MKTRAEMYAKEADELLRTVSLYKTLDERQIFRMFPGKENSIKALLGSLIKQKRVTYNPDSKQVNIGGEATGSPDLSMIASFWVLLDFIEKTEFHTVGDYPVKISFFSTDAEYYEIIHVSAGNEMIINRAFGTKTDDPGKRLIIVDNTSQIPAININGTVCFCTVSSEGTVSYYKSA